MWEIKLYITKIPWSVNTYNFGQKAEGSTWSRCRVGATSEVLKQLVPCACGKMPGSLCILLDESKILMLMIKRKIISDCQ
jgi:hypothetical protein